MAKHHGHYCKICSEYKANEKFSGKGHASHICKQCAQLPPAAQSEQMAVNKLENMSGRSPNKDEIKYLRARSNDPRPAVKAVERETHHVLLPVYERGDDDESDANDEIDEEVPAGSFMLLERYSACGTVCASDPSMMCLMCGVCHVRRRRD